jgi:hypothetical protein
VFFNWLIRLGKTASATAGASGSPYAPIRVVVQDSKPPVIRLHLSQIRMFKEHLIRHGLTLTPMLQLYRAGNQARRKWSKAVGFIVSFRPVHMGWLESRRELVIL